MSRLKLPHKIKVFDHWLRIYYVNELPNKHGTNDHGEFDEEQKRILITINNPDFMLQALVHELTHAMLCFSGISQLLSAKLEEAICVCNENILKTMVLSKRSPNIKWKFYEFE